MTMILFSVLLTTTSAKEFSNMLQNKFKMFMMGELVHILRLKIHQSKKQTFIGQTKYNRYLLKRFYMDKTNQISIPMNIAHNLHKCTKKKK